MVPSPAGHEQLKIGEGDCRFKHPFAAADFGMRDDKVGRPPEYGLVTFLAHGQYLFHKRNIKPVGCDALLDLVAKFLIDKVLVFAGFLNFVQHAEHDELLIAAGGQVAHGPQKSSMSALSTCSSLKCRMERRLAMRAFIWSLVGMFSPAKLFSGFLPHTDMAALGQTARHRWHSQQVFQ